MPQKKGAIPWNKGLKNCFSADVILKFKNRKPMLGKKHSEETKLRMSLASKGKQKSQEHIQNMIKSKIGVPHMLTDAGKKSFSEKMKGENNPKWIKNRKNLVGRHDRRFHDTEYKQWVMNVRNRDGWKCKISNRSCSGRLETHHILGWKSHPELRYQTNNGITLCHFHHPRKKDDEKKLSPYFQELVASLD